MMKCFKGSVKRVYERWEKENAEIRRILLKPKKKKKAKK